MQRAISALALTAASSVAIYAFFPVPGFSIDVESWRAAGSYKIFRGYKVFYRDEEGQGDTGTTLLIHGFTQSSYSWRKIWSYLKTINRRVVAVDMLGCGFSDKPDFPTYDLAFHADLYEHIMSQLGIQDVHIIACDMGDNVAVELLARHEDRLRSTANNKVPRLNVKSLCVLNGRTIIEQAEIMPIEKILMTPVLGAIICRYVYGFNLFADTLLKLYGSTKPRLNELKDEWAIFRFNYGNAVANKFVYYTVDRINQASRHTRAIRQTKVPRYFIVGMEDPHVGDDIIGAWKRNVSADSIVELNGAGHYPYLEKPREMFNAYQNFRKSIMPNVTKSNSAPQSNESPRSEANNKSATNATKDAKNQAKL